MFLNSCKSIKYSISGASIHPDCKTFSVDYFDNVADVVNPVLSNYFTEALKEKIRQQTNLEEVVNRNSDINFEGKIIGYDVSSIDITRDEVSTYNRLTITVKAKYTNIKDDSFEFDTNFSFHADFPSTQSLPEVEEPLIEEIVPKIIDDIYNKAFVNW